MSQTEQLDLFGKMGLPPIGDNVFFNTTHLRGPALAECKVEASLQERAVMAIFREKKRHLGPSEVWLHGKDVLGDSWLLTSVRRAITNLTSKDKLIKTTVMADGVYGRQEHTWKLP